MIFICRFSHEKITFLWDIANILPENYHILIFHTPHAAPFWCVPLLFGTNNIYKGEGLW